jgi:hypothetical protein
MTFLFIRLPYRSESQPSPRRSFRPNQPDLEAFTPEAERHQQAVEHLREVEAKYNLERRIFF